VETWKGLGRERKRKGEERERKREGRERGGVCVTGFSDDRRPCKVVPGKHQYWRNDCEIRSDSTVLLVGKLSPFSPPPLRSLSLPSPGYYL